MKCDTCNGDIEIGSWPFCPDHGKPIRIDSGKDAYWDDNLQKMISNPGDRNAALRPYWQNDHLCQIQPKERPAGYFRELNDRRRDRSEREKRDRK